MDFIQQLQLDEVYNQTLPDSIKFPDYKKNLHKGAIYTSRLLPTGEITQLLSQSQETNATEYSDSLAMNFTNLDLKSQKIKRQLSLESQTKTDQGETKLTK